MHKSTFVTVSRKAHLNATNTEIHFLTVHDIEVNYTLMHYLETLSVWQ